jgi:hypothetical protein
MYHDQGHIPMKLLAFDSGVNVSIGLPILRTSVDHGTAFDIAGRGIAREESLLAAIAVAVQMAAAADGVKRVEEDGGNVGRVAHPVGPSPSGHRRTCRRDTVEGLAAVDGTSVSNGAMRGVGVIWR